MNRKISELDEALVLLPNAFIPIVQGNPLDDYKISKESIASAIGIPIGGGVSQVLAKKSATNYDTEWVDVEGTGGGVSKAYVDAQDLLKVDNVDGFGLSENNYDDAAVLEVAKISGKEDALPYPGVPIGDVLTDDGTFKPVMQAVGGYANNLYFNETASDVLTYETLSYTPNPTTEIETWVVKASDGEKLFKNYLYPSAVLTTILPAGVWSFQFYGKVDSSAGETRLGVTYFRRLADNSEVDLFTLWSSEINNTVDGWIKLEITNPAYTLVATDRMGCRIKAQTTHPNNIIITYAIGDGYGAWINNPNAIRHTQLRAHNQDLTVQHIDSATEKTTPINADSVLIWDSVAIKAVRTSFANFKGLFGNAMQNIAGGTSMKSITVGRASCSIAGLGVNYGLPFDSFSMEINKLGGSNYSQLVMKNGRTFYRESIGAYYTVDGLSGGAITKFTELTADAVIAVKNATFRERNGFLYPSKVVIEYDKDTRTMKLRQTSTGLVDGTLEPIQFYRFGELITMAYDINNWWVSAAHTNVTTTSHFLMYKSGFAWDTDVWNLEAGDAPIAMALPIYNASISAIEFIGIRETHGTVMDDATHYNLHKNVGTVLNSGGDFSNFTKQTTGNANRRPTVSAAVLLDEDLKTSIPAITTNSYAWGYMAMVGGVATFVASFGNTDIVKLEVGTSKPQYNSFISNNWGFTTLANAYFTRMFSLAMPTTSDPHSSKYSTLFIQGQNNVNSNSIALTFEPSALNLGGLMTSIQESIFTSGIVIKCQATTDWYISALDKITGSRYSQSSTPVGLSSTITPQAEDTAVIGQVTIEANSVKILSTPLTQTTTPSATPMLLSPATPTDFTKVNEMTVVFSTGASVPSITIQPLAPLVAGTAFHWMGKIAPTLAINSTYTFVFFWVNATICQVYHEVKK